MRSGWEEKKLGEVLALEYGKPLPPNERSAGGKYAVYGANGIKDRSDKFYSDRRSIIVGRKGSAGEITLTEDAFWPLDVTYFVTFDETKYDLQFLYHLLSLQDLTKLAKGVKPGINRNEVYSKSVRVPPLPEQRRVVAILDEAFAGLATATANAEKNLKNARDLFDGYLNYIVAKGGVGWADKKLSEICEVKDGTHDSPKYVESGIPFVTQKNITEDGLSLSDVRFISEADHVNFFRRSNAMLGDILISMIGANRGMACAVDDPTTFSIKNVGLIKSGPNINQAYLLYFLKSAKAQEYVRVASRGGAQEFIGLTKLREFPIAVPPPKEQLTFVAVLDELLEKTRELRSAYRRKLEYLGDLKRSILQKAFSGELTSPPSQAIKEAAE